MEQQIGSHACTECKAKQIQERTEWPERQDNLCENILAGYLYTYLHGLFLSFSSVLEKLKSPLTCHCLKHMVAMHVFDSPVYYKVEYKKKKKSRFHNN